MDYQLKKFHFQELDWILCFPESGNQGKYVDYSILFTDRRNKQAQEQHVRIGEILGKPEFEEHFPHTVGFFKNYSGQGANFKPEYMELRFITNIDDFWLFLNALNL